MKTLLLEPGPIDPALRSHRADTRFMLTRGRYTTESSLAFADLDYSMLGPGCELIGAGTGETIIDVVPPGPLAARAWQIECLTAGSRSGRAERVALRGFTLNCPDVTSPALNLPGVVGVHVWADEAEVAGLSINGITGTRPTANGQPSREGFGLLVNQAGQPVNPGRSVVEHVWVRLAELFTPGKAEHYTCAVYLGIASPCYASFMDNVGCSNPSAIPGHAAFGVNGGVIARTLSNTGRWNRAIFCDTAGGSGTCIDQSNLRAERVAMEFRGARVTWRDIILRDSFVTLLPDPDAYAAALVIVDDSNASDPTPSVFDTVQIRGCVIRCSPAAGKPGQKPAQFYPGSLDARNASNVGLIGNTISAPPGVRIEAPVITKISPPGGFIVA